MVHHQWYQITGFILCLVRSQCSLPELREIKYALLMGVASLDANACIKPLMVLLARILLIA